MGHVFDKLFKTGLALMLIFSSLMFVSPVQAAETTYEIYPTPHKIEYVEESFVMRKDVNVVLDGKIDNETKNHIVNVLKSKNKTITFGNEKVDGKTNVLIGINGSGDYVDSYAKKNYNYAQSLFEHYGAYYFSTIHDEIVIVGRDSDAAFYGITTLKQIFNQIDGSQIRHLTIEDYADVNIRGFIEGYYGIPWSNKDRMELMKFGGDIKMTSYIFAPKDDPYHKEKWREKYPEKELAALKEMVKVGNDTKCRFVWTAHPFMGGFKQNDADNEIQRLIDKFEHLYNDASVRQFGVLADDVGQLPREIIIKMMKRVGEWAKSKGDVYDVVFCPTGYNHGWQTNQTGYAELNDYDKGFPDNIQIFWTGEGVCKPIEQTTLNHFRNHKATNGTRRAPLFWLNWPVNDINHSRMLMGHSANLLQKDIKINDLAGAVTNPMQESEPSKVAIFQVANYAWNIKNYNAEQTWKDSFKYIDAEAANELYTLAKHMSNPAPNTHELVMPESEEMKPLLTAFKNKLSSNSLGASDIDSLIQEFTTIINACDGFNANSNNAEMKKDLKPYIASLRDLSDAIVNFLQSKKALMAGEKHQAFDCFSKGQNKLKASANHTKPMLGGGKEAVDPGSTELIPFAKFLENNLAQPMNEFIGAESNELKITAETNYQTWHQGNVNNIIDGQDNTHAWSDQYEAVDKYFQINYSKPQTIYGVHILNGANAENKHSDTFKDAKVQYKVNGEWNDLKSVTNYPERVDITDIEHENVEAVRYICTGTGTEKKWVSMREFRVSLTPENSNFSKSVLDLIEGWSVSSGQKSNMIDDNETTFVHFNVRQNGNPADTYKVGDNYGIKLSRPITLGRIKILQGGHNQFENDYFYECKLQYSLDGQAWQDIKGAEFVNRKDIVFDASDLNIKAQYVRLVAKDSRKNWVAVREFDVDAKAFYNVKAYTNVENLEIRANVYDDYASIQPKENVVLKPGEYVGLKLDRIHEISSITQNLSNDQLTVEVGLNEYEFKNYTNGSVNARYIRVINHTNNSITFNLNELSTVHNEFKSKSFVANQSSGFKIYTKENSKALNIFDGDWNTQTIFDGNQVAGNKFVYDLGQVIDLNKLKLVCKDSETDFPRHAKIFVSDDLNDWTEVMTIGNQDGDNTPNEEAIEASLPVHETSYNTKEVSLSKAVPTRYIKFEITRTKSGEQRWVRFQEFVINDGAYLPTVNNPTFESDCNDTAGGEYENLVDADLSSYFIPDSDTGSLTYHISDDNNKNFIKIVQDSSKISNATVTAKVVSSQGSRHKLFGKNVETLTLGTLSQTVNEFILPNDTTLLSLTISWKDMIPNLSEFMIGNKDDSPVNKNELEQMLNSNVDTSSWTHGSIDAYKKALEAGKVVKESEYVSQDSVDSVVKLIQDAIKNKKIKGDIKQLQDAIQDKNARLYTVSSWRNYQITLNKLNQAIENANNVSVEDVQKLLEEYKASLAGLKYSPLTAEEATILVEDMSLFVDSVNVPQNTYTLKSWNNFVTSIKELKDTLVSNKDKEVNPESIQKQIDKVKENKTQLVSIVSLVSEIKEFDSINSEHYSSSSYNAYKAVVDEARKLLNEGTVEQVEKAVKDLVLAKKQLKPAVNANNVKELIEELKSLKKENYTSDSYHVLQVVIKEVESLGDIDRLTKNQLEEVADKLAVAKSGLVNIEALNKVIDRASHYKEDSYTKDSYKELKDLLSTVDKLKKSGTSEEVNQFVINIDKAIKHLQERVSKDLVDKYIKDIVFNNKKDDYTKESYDAYKKAYDQLIALSKNIENTSREQFFDAVNEYELSIKQLVKVNNSNVDSQNMEHKPETGDHTSVIYYVGAMILTTALYVCLSHRRKTIDKE